MTPARSIARNLDGSSEITRLLNRYSQGDETALEALLPLVYAELHRIAERQMRRERQGHTLQATALIHEAFLSVSKQKSIAWEGRSHFLAVSALAMRQVLAGYARQKKSLKRNHGFTAVSLDERVHGKENKTIDIVALDEALTQLEKESPRQAKVVELRYFSGLSLIEIAQVLKVSHRTTEREWRFAKAWLYNFLSS